LGFRFTSSMNSASVFAGNDSFTVMTNGVEATIDTGVKSRSGS
jgi:hypothetical protein